MAHLCPNLISAPARGRPHTPARVLVGIGATRALLSTLVLNDAVVLFFTPVVIHACRRLGADPVPYLVVEAIGANLGNVATQVGNP